MPLSHLVRLRASGVPRRLATVVLLAFGVTACGAGTEVGGESTGGAEGTFLASPPEIEGLPELTWHLLEEASWIDDAVWLGDGWAVLDGFQGRLHRLEQDGAPSTGAGFAGGAGEGPGELGAPRLLTGDDLGVWVVGMGGRLDRFDLEGRLRRPNAPPLHRFLPIAGTPRCRGPGRCTPPLGGLPES